MRDILFRGKDGNRWIEGSLLIFPNTGRTKILKWNQADLDFDQIEVDPETVCQYTGMNDKNGEKIFDGDVIYRNWFGGRTYRVVYDDICGIVIGTTGEVFTTFDGDSDCFEIIGNIYDNPELVDD